MPPTCLSHSSGTDAAFDAQVARYRRAYQRALRRRPTTLQRELMTTAAIAQVRFDIALRDPKTGPQNLAHWERIRRKAIEAMVASFPPIKTDPDPSLLVAHP